jgi:hypothetical protein
VTRPGVDVGVLEEDMESALPPSCSTILHGHDTHTL